VRVDIIIVGIKVARGSVAIADMYGFEPPGRSGTKALVALSNIYGFIAVIFVGLFIAAEFTRGTIRNALCAGASRTLLHERVTMRRRAQVSQCFRGVKMRTKLSLFQD
jgi:hypothetical protein